MKKIIITFLFLTLIVFFPKNTYAATSSPKPSVSPEQENIQQIDDLKTRIASRVAQLKLVEKKGIIGTVTDATNSQITLNDVNGNVRFVDVDELTKFSNPNIKSSTTFGISDISKGMTIGVLGLYNKQSRRILAKQISTLTLPKVITGAVSSIDNKNFSFYMVSEDNKKIFVDVETVTKTYSYTSGETLATAGFSKLKVDLNLIVIGFADKQNPENIIASRILLFPSTTKNPKINYVPALNPNSSVIPSTGSGKKLTPIIK